MTDETLAVLGVLLVGSFWMISLAGKLVFGKEVWNGLVTRWIYDISAAGFRLVAKTIKAVVSNMRP